MEGVRVWPHLRCARCGSKITSWRRPYCRDFERCIHLRWIEEVEGWTGDGEQIAEPEPVIYDEHPADFDDCSVCWGKGQVYRHDWEMGPVPEDCPRCDTTGVDPSLCPA